MKSFAHRVTAATMAMLISLSSTGFSMDVHYCQEEIQGVSLFGKAKSCHDQQDTPPCHQTKKSCHHSQDGNPKVAKKSCCHNETIVVEHNDLDVTPTPLTNNPNLQLEFLAAYVVAFVLNYRAPADHKPYKHYIPPIPDKDVQVLYQTFLI